MTRKTPLKTGKLPSPQVAGSCSLEETLIARRSVREFSDQPLTNAEVAQLLWAAQGITDAEGVRTAPSAGALYPLNLYIVMASGFFQYVPAGHRLALKKHEDLRPDLCDAALAQEAVAQAPAVFVMTAVYARTARKYGSWAERYVLMEVGHAAQNLLLTAVALKLGAVPIAAIDDDRVREVLELPERESPLYLIPVGHPASL